MPQLEVATLTGTAVLWPITGYDSYGQALIGPPTEIPVRWLDKEREVLDKQGNTVAIDATVTTDRRVYIGSILWKGRLEDWSVDAESRALNPLDAALNTEVFEAKTYNGTPDIKGRSVFHDVGLMRLRKSLPPSGN